MSNVWTGLDVIQDQPETHLSGQRTGLLTNPSGIDRTFRTSIDILNLDPRCNLVALFGPEHGVRGEAQAGDHVADARDQKTGLPIHSLYGETRKPTPSMLEGLDLMVVDLQDLGVRYATYLSTLSLVQHACAEAGIDVMILDRPNPLGGQGCAGNVLESGYESFVGVDRIPIVHGLTAGEFALWHASSRQLPAPKVVRMRNWDVSRDYADTGLPWVPPSPNLPTLESLRLYPGTCLFEGTTISEGRGTTRPFETIGAPWVDPDLLANALNERRHSGVWFRPVWFTPTFSKHHGERCGGVFIHVTEPAVLDAVAVGLDMLGTVARLWPEHFSWLPPSDGQWFIDLLAGSSSVRNTIDSGGDVLGLVSQWKQQVEEFQRESKAFWLYDRPFHEERM